MQYKMNDEEITTEKKLILTDYILNWFEEQEDPYHISQDKILENFIFQEFIFEYLTIQQLEETNLIIEILDTLYSLLKDFIEFEFNYRDKKRN